MTKNRFITLAMTIASLALAAGITTANFLHPQEVVHTVTVTKKPAPAPTVTVTAKPKKKAGGALPACKQEDDDNCYWDAMKQGNGEGASFVALNGKVYYEEYIYCYDGFIARDKDGADEWGYCEPNN